MRKICSLLTLLALSGCSLFVPKLEPPDLSIVGVQWLKSDLWRQQLAVRVRVNNPNNRTLPIKEVTYTLELDGQQFSQGQSQQSFIVPARGEAQFDLSVSVDLAGVLLKLAGERRAQVDYHLTGKVLLSEGIVRNIPFDDHGTFTLP